MTRCAKIVATIGPASRDPQTIEALLQAGVDVARLNFSHGTQAEHAEVIACLVCALPGIIPRKIDVGDIAQLILGIVGNADGGDVAIQAHPLVRAGELQVRGRVSVGHVVFLPPEWFTVRVGA